MRYHFHIREADAVIRDDEGSEFATIEAARAEARASVRDLVIQDLRSGKPRHAWRVEIADAAGTVLGSVGLSVCEI